MSMRGVWAASLTPLKDDMSIDHGGFARHVSWLHAKGCDGVAVFGSTGEANSFTTAERIAAVDALASAGIDMAGVVVGAGACAFPDAVAMTRHAGSLGCAGVLVTPPFYYKGVSDEGIFAFMERLIEGADGPRIMLYHFPRLVAAGYSEDLIARMVAAWPESIVALKDSSGDIERMTRIAVAHPSVNVLAGTERLLLDLLEAGGAGCLTASANLTSVLAARVFSERSSGLQTRLTQARTALESKGFVPGLKQVMFEATDEPAWLNIRPPLERLSGPEAGELMSAVEGYGVLPNLG